MRQRPVAFFLVIVALLVGVIWWLCQPPAAPVPEKLVDAPKAESPKPAATEPPMPSATASPSPAPRLEMPVVKPAPQSPPMPSVPKDATDSDKKASQLQSDTAQLDTAVTDICNRLQTGDIVGFLQNYMAPSNLAKNGLERLAQFLQSRDGQPVLQEYMKRFQSLQGLTPTFNDAGDEATYTVPDPDGKIPFSMVWRKIDGRWYAL